MWFKVILPALLAVSLVQSHIPQSSSNQHTNYEEDEQLEIEFNKLKESTENTIKKYQKAYIEMNHQLKRVTHPILLKMYDCLQSVVDELLAEVKVLEDRAKEQGIDIEPCLGYRKKLIILFPKSYGHMVQGLWDDANYAGLLITKDGKKEAQKSMHEVDVLKNQYEQCNDLPSSERTVCHTAVVAKMRKAADSIPASLEKYEEKITKYIQNVPGVLIANELACIERSRTLGETWIGEISKCIDSKINPQSVN